MGKRKPTAEQPCRSVAPVGNLSGSVSGIYQAVVKLPPEPTKRDELLAFALAARSLALLAERWAEKEKSVESSEDTRDVRLDVTIRMIPEKSEQRSE